MRLDESDRLAVRALTYDATSQPAYETIKSCLVWPDEVPGGVSSTGYEFIGELLAVRGLMHRKVPFERWPLNPEHHKAVWLAGMQEIPEWPGFRRIELSDADALYLQKSLQEDAEADI